MTSVCVSQKLDISISLVIDSETSLCHKKYDDLQLLERVILAYKEITDKNLFKMIFVTYNLNQTFLYINETTKMIVIIKKFY